MSFLFTPIGLVLIYAGCGILAYALHLHLLQYSAPKSAEKEFNTDRNYSLFTGLLGWYGILSYVFLLVLVFYSQNRKASIGLCFRKPHRMHMVTKAHQEIFDYDQEKDG